MELYQETSKQRQDAELYSTQTQFTIALFPFLHVHYNYMRITMHQKKGKYKNCTKGKTGTQQNDLHVL